MTSNFMQVHKKGFVDPLNLQVDDILIETIAHSLSQQCRYAGHVNKFYSVGEHSFLLSWEVEIRLTKAGVSEKEIVETCLWALLHDATEAFLVDIPRPLKHRIPEYYTHEAAAEVVVAEKFGLKLPMPPIIKELDTAICALERVHLMEPTDHSNREWCGMDVDVSSFTVPIFAFPPLGAKHPFIARYNELIDRRRKAE